MVPSRQTALPPGAMTVQRQSTVRMASSSTWRKCFTPNWSRMSWSSRPLPLLDHQVGVQKAVAQGFGQKNAHSALARAGHADENDVVQSVILPLYRLISELV